MEEEHLKQIMQEIIMPNKKRASRNRATFYLEQSEANLLKETEKKEKTVPVYQRLIKMMIDNDVKAQEEFLEKHPEAVTDEIDDFGNTIFHFIGQQPDNPAAIKLLQKYVGQEPTAKTVLERENVNGLTAVHIAACAGNTEALRVFKDKYQTLLNIKDAGQDGWLPIHHAAFFRREETVRYLLQVTDLQAENLLLDLLVSSNLPGLALELLKMRPQLTMLDKNSSWGSTVDKLAKKSLSFKSERELGILESLIYSIIPVNDDDQDHDPSRLIHDDIEMPIIRTDHDASRPLHNDTEIPNISSDHSKEIQILPQRAAKIGALKQKLYTSLWKIPIQPVPHIKRIHDQKHMHSQTLKLVRMMISNVTWTYNKATENLKKPVLTAARLGIHEFVNEVLKAYPNSVLFKDEEGRNIFLLAVLYRKENVFNLIHGQVASIKDHTNYLQDIYGYNILHLAGKMSVTPSQVPGAALQMQQELRWFMDIKEFSQHSLQEEQNEDDLTPRELFTKEHGDLIKKGEEWMRNTATSCSVVGALIITIVFAAAFTVPGGSNVNGVPNYLNETYFRIFAISIALALFASTTSVQIFLGMLTSRYAEKDFLRALPNKLIIGLAALFWSSTSMMVAFGAAFCILLSHPWKWVIILICLLGCIPVTLFAWMQFPLLVDIIRFTYGPGILKPKKNVCMKILKYCRQDP